ncbi:XRE family transcriptional regulator [Aliarcobacter butzleri]
MIRSNEVVQTEENLIKKACEEFQVTQKELAEIMKINDVTVRNWSSKGQIPESSKRHLRLLIENKKLSEELESKKILELIKEFDFTSLSYNDLKEIKNIISK